MKKIAFAIAVSFLTLTQASCLADWSGQGRPVTAEEMNTILWNHYNEIVVHQRREAARQQWIRQQQWRTYEAAEHARYNEQLYWLRHPRGEQPVRGEMIINPFCPPTKK